MFLFIVGVSAVLLAVFFLVFPKIGVWTLTFLSIFQLTYFHRWTVVNIPRFFAWLPFFVAILLIIPLVIERFFYRQIFAKKVSLLRLLYLFVLGMIIVSTVSSYVNGTDLLTSLFGIRYILLLLIMATALHTYRNLGLDINSFMRFTVWIGIVQIPFAIFQRVLFSNFGIILTGQSQDLISGTFSSYSTMCFFQLMALSIVVSFWVRTGKAIIGKFILPLIVGLCVPIALSNARAIFLFLMILIFLVIVRFHSVLVKRFVKFYLYGIALLVLVYFGSMFTFWSFQKREFGRDIKRQYKIDYLLNYVLRPSMPAHVYLVNGGDPRMGRIRALTTSIDLIKGDWTTLLFGLGAGSTQQSQVFASSGKYFQSYGPLSGLGRTDISLVLAEFGGVGILLYLYLFAGMWRVIARHKAKGAIKYYFVKDAFFFMAFFFAINAVYSQGLSNYAVLLYIAYFIAMVEHKNATPQFVGTL